MEVRGKTQEEVGRRREGRRRGWPVTERWWNLEPDPRPDRRALLSEDGLGTPR